MVSAINMSSLFTSVLRQALKTFDCKNQGTFAANFKLLKQLTDQLSVDDILADQRDFLTDAYYERPQSAPCTFVNIFENDIVSMSVFVLRGNFKMPLHDHPQMHGILRGISGNLNVQSYTALPNNLGNVAPGKQFAYAETPLLVNSETECAVLTPCERNFHEITAVERVAAFFDILSPPYNNSRHCNFYRCVSSSSAAAAVTRQQQQLQQQMQRHKDIYHKNVVLLESVPVPNTYYCDTEPTPDIITQHTAHIWTEII